MTPRELADLDLAVAEAEGVEVMLVGLDCSTRDPRWGALVQKAYQPTRDWSLAGPLLDKYKLNLGHDHRGAWATDRSVEGMVHYAETTCIAICKAVVALKKECSSPL